MTKIEIDTRNKYDNIILLCGIQKTGNTWARFVLFNYFNIRDNEATETLTFDELRAIHNLRRIRGKARKGMFITKHKNDGFPDIYHTHLSYDGTGFIRNFKYVHLFFDKCKKLIYIYRNPYDTMISYHKFIFNRDKIPYKQINMDLKRKLEDFTRYYLPKFIIHVNETMHRADVILNYDKLRKDPSGFIDAIKLVDSTIDIDIFWKAVKMSSFDNIKKMSDKVNQPYGIGGSLYRGYFCRDGRTGQYKEIMSEELIRYIKFECQKAEISVWNGV